MCSDKLSLLRLRVVADADPGALARVLERFQNLNVLPRSVTAELCTAGAFHVQVDIAGVAESTLTSIAAKLGQIPCIQNAYWHRL
jgi:(p)ppGpp synthase/HD superfamily hydrolase